MASKSAIDNELDSLLQSLGNGGQTTAAAPKKQERVTTMRIDNELDALMNSLGSARKPEKKETNQQQQQQQQQQSNQPVTTAKSLDAELEALMNSSTLKQPNKSTPSSSSASSNSNSNSNSNAKQGDGWERTTAAEQELSALMESLSSGMSSPPTASATTATTATVKSTPTPVVATKVDPVKTVTPTPVVATKVDPVKTVTPSSVEKSQRTAAADAGIAAMTAAAATATATAAVKSSGDEPNEPAPIHLHSGTPPTPIAKVPISSSSSSSSSSTSSSVPASQQQNQQQQALAAAAAAQSSQLKSTPQASKPVAVPTPTPTPAAAAQDDGELDDLMSELTAPAAKPVVAVQQSQSKPTTASTNNNNTNTNNTNTSSSSSASSRTPAASSTLGAGLADLVSMLDSEISTTPSSTSNNNAQSASTRQTSVSSKTPAQQQQAQQQPSQTQAKSGAVSSQLGNLLEDLMGMETTVDTAVAQTLTVTAAEEQPPPEPEKPKLPPMPDQPGVCGCGQHVQVGQFLTALDRKWHPGHFNCYKCNSSLLNVQFFPYEGRPLCQQDFKEIFAPKCPGCSNAVLGPCVNAINKVYHRECFKCKNCAKDFPGGQFFERTGRLYCQACFQTVFVPRCGRCDQMIYGEMINALGKNWHTSNCFTCKTCSQPFTHGAYFEGKDGFPYCQKCYHVVSNLICAVCTNPCEGKAIAAGDQRYHTRCFCCSECKIELIGQAFRSRAQGNAKELYCLRCHDKLFD